MSTMAAKAVRKLSDAEIETLINLWHNEPALWDSSNVAYSNADVRKAALERICKQMSDMDKGGYQ
jgi:hypothetical protein